MFRTCWKNELYSHLLRCFHHKKVAFLPEKITYTAALSFVDVIVKANIQMNISYVESSVLVGKTKLYSHRLRCFHHHKKVAFSPENLLKQLPPAWILIVKADTQMKFFVRRCAVLVGKNELYSHLVRCFHHKKKLPFLPQNLLYRLSSFVVVIVKTL